MPKDTLSATALIEHDGDRFLVWLCHDNPENHPDNHSFVAGQFTTFDAAVEALAGVTGLTIEKKIYYRGQAAGGNANAVLAARAKEVGRA